MCDKMHTAACLANGCGSAQNLIQRSGLSQSFFVGLATRTPIPIQSSGIEGETPCMLQQRPPYALESNECNCLLPSVKPSCNNKSCKTRPRHANAGGHYREADSCSRKETAHAHHLSVSHMQLKCPSVPSHHPSSLHPAVPSIPESLLVGLYNRLERAEYPCYPTSSQRMAVCGHCTSL